MGVGMKIYDAIEIKAHELDLLVCITKHLPQSHFLHMGSSLVREQQVDCRGETFTII